MATHRLVFSTVTPFRRNLISVHFNSAYSITHYEKLNLAKSFFGVSCLCQSAAELIKKDDEIDFVTNVVNESAPPKGERHEKFRRYFKTKNAFMKQFNGKLKNGETCFQIDSQLAYLATT